MSISVSSAAHEFLRQRLGGRRLRAGRRNDVEFVAADAGEEGALAGLLHAARDFAQQRVADRVAEHVVDRLEAVEVDAEQREAFRRILGEVERGGDAFVERRPVRQIGERIVMRHVRDALLVALAVGDVVDDADQILRLAVGAHDRHAACAVAIRVPLPGVTTACSSRR